VSFAGWFLPTDKVFRLTQGKRANLGTMMKRIIARAGVPVWPKPFVNMRATRAIELRQKKPTYKVNAWLGHCEATANEHYFKVSERDYQDASKSLTLNLTLLG
jgi:hypothetical protein